MKSPRVPDLLVLCLCLPACSGLLDLDPPCDDDVCGDETGDAPDDESTGSDNENGSESGGDAHLPESGVESFSYTVTAELVGSYFPFSWEQHGTVHWPDVEASTVDMNLAGVPLRAEMIRDGGCVFVRGELPWVDGTFSPLPYFALRETGEPLSEALDGLEPEITELDGEPVLRYTLDASTFGAVVETAVSVPDPFEPPAIELWVDPDHEVPRRIEVTTIDPDGGGSWHLTIQIDDIGEAPAVTLPGECTGATEAPADAPMLHDGGARAPNWTTRGPMAEDSDFWDDVYTVVDVVVQAVTNGFSPKSVQESVEIVEEATPSIKENVDNIEEWREANPEDPTVGRAFREPDNDPDDKHWLYRWFWSVID